MTSGIVNPKADFTAPADDAVVITPSDTVDFTKGPCRAIYVGVTGDITLVTLAGNAVLHSNVSAGPFPIRASRVNATGTTATNMVAWY